MDSYKSLHIQCRKTYIGLVYTLVIQRLTEENIMAEHNPDIDQFTGKIVKSGNSHGVTIPSRNMEFSGLKEGDIVKVWYKKIIQQQEE